MELGFWKLTGVPFILCEAERERYIYIYIYIYVYVYVYVYVDSVQSGAFNFFGGYCM